MGGLENRLRQDTDSVRKQLGSAIGELGHRMDAAEKRMEGLSDEVNRLVDKRLGTNLGNENDALQAKGEQGPSLEGSVRPGTYAAVTPAK